MGLKSKRYKRDLVKETQINELFITYFSFICNPLSKSIERSNNLCVTEIMVIMNRLSNYLFLIHNQVRENNKKNNHFSVSCKYQLLGIGLFSHFLVIF